MRFLDDFGQDLNQGDFVRFPLALGQNLDGQIVKVDSGLGLQTIAPGKQTPSPAMIIVSFAIPMLAQPNGQVIGITKLPKPAEPKLV